MNTRLFLALIASCTAAMAARPAAPAPAAAPAESAAPAPTLNVGPYQLQNRSSFALSMDTRTPMWPIGWVRPQGQSPQTPTPAVGSGFQLQPHHLKVTSILMLAGEPLATINGRAFGEGEVLPVYLGARPVKVVLKAIRDGGVFVEHNGRQIFCPIQRKNIEDKATNTTPSEGEKFQIKINEK